MYVISNKIRLCLFALIMSFCTSTTVSGVTIFFSRDDLSEFFIVWLSSTIKSWPLVFLLIIFYLLQDLLIYYLLYIMGSLQLY